MIGERAVSYYIHGGLKDDRRYEIKQILSQDFKLCATRGHGSLERKIAATWRRTAAKRGNKRADSSQSRLLVIVSSCEMREKEGYRDPHPPTNPRFRNLGGFLAAHGPVSERIREAKLPASSLSLMLAASCALLTFNATLHTNHSSFFQYCP